MSDEIEKVRVLMETAQRKLRDLDKQAIALRSEIVAYEKVCAILSGQDGVHVNGRCANASEPVSGKKSRGLSETWLKVVGWINTQATPPETERVYAFTQEASLNVNRNTLRSQLSVYTGQGILRRVDGGYLVTAAGLSLLQNQTLDESPNRDESEAYSSMQRGGHSVDEPNDLDSEIPF